MCAHVCVCVRACVCVCVNDREREGAWREGIFGLHAVLHKFVIACWMLWSTLTMNISNDPSRGLCVCVCFMCVYVCSYLNELAVMKHWTLDWNDSGLFISFFSLSFL